MNMVKLLINNTTMKFHEILTKAERDISKNCNFTRNQLFSRTERQIVKKKKWEKTTSTTTTNKRATMALESLT